MNQSLIQIRALLWKNYKLRRANKTRLIAELVWPLFLFLILMWVRTRGLRTFMPNCYFTEKALPSSGLLPFIRSSICELNYSCYEYPIEKNYDEDFLLKLTQVATNITNDLIRVETVQAKNDVHQILIRILEQRQLATNLTRQSKLEDYLINKLNFTRNLRRLYPHLTTDTRRALLESSPNYNLLYLTNHSQKLTQPSLLKLIPTANNNNNNQANAVINFLYGSDLDRLEEPKIIVNRTKWLSEALCSKDNDTRLFRSSNTQLICELNNNLNNSNLIEFISTSIDFNRLRQFIYDNTQLSDLSLFTSLQGALAPAKLLQIEYNKIQLGLKDVFFDNFTIEKTLCGQSKLNLFNLFGLFNLTNESSTDFLYINDLPLPPTEGFIKTLSKLNRISNLDRDTCEKEFNLSLRVNSSKSCLCEMSFYYLDRLPFGISLFWKQLKPFILGKIVYSPSDNHKVNEIISNINVTFQSIHHVSMLLRDLSSLAYNLTQFKPLISSLNISFDSSMVNMLDYLHEVPLILSNLLNCVELNKFEGYLTEEEAVEKGMQHIHDDTYWSAFIFNTSESGSKKISYKIRMNTSYTQNTFFKQDRFFRYGPNNCPTCNIDFLYGFIYLQDLVEKAIIEVQTNKTQSFGLTTQMMPYPCYIDDKFVKAIERLLPLFMVLAWILTVSMLVKDIVYEKEMRLKEFMKVMGLSNGIHWISWFITSFCIMFSICIALCFILKYGKITIYSDLSVLLVFFCCFCLAAITQCFLVSVFFNRANLAAAATGLIYYILYLPYSILVNYSDVLPIGYKYLASLSSTVAFSYGCELMSVYENQAEGVTWHNFYKSPYTDGGLTMNDLCLMMLLDSFIYILLTWYWENVLPGEFGLSKPFYYPLLPSYWCPSLVKDSLEDTFDNKDNETNDECMNKSEIGIEIRNLHKIYKRDRLHALKGISVNFYSNEITSLLGHNGAGKSTLMNILTGIYEYTPMSNTRIKINGTKLNKNNINKLRHEYIGYVPQYNILFDKLTVYEHLLFYSYLKYTPLEGQSSKTRTDINRQIDELLRDTLLYKHKSKYASELSGGMKRKLSVAIAFVGNSRICILDEPSAGVDPLGRRSIWDLLFKYKSTRTIIISTHHMDEADILGDRICILSNGTIVTHGTCDDIKQEYGNGYTITLFSKHDQDTFKSDQILEFIKNTIPNAYIMNDSNNQNEIKVSIGNDKTKFKDLFKILEDNQDRLSIKEHVSIQDTTLEEIFIKIAKQPELTTAPNDSFAYRMANLLLNKFKSLLKRSDECIEQPVNNLKKDVNSVDNGDDEEYRTLMNESIITNSLQLSLQQLRALLIKRFNRTKRNLKGFLAEIVLPIVFVCLALLVAVLIPKFEPRPALEIHPWFYDIPNHVFYSEGKSLTDEVRNITKTFYARPSLGTRCMKNHTINVLKYRDRSRSIKSFSKLDCLEEGYSSSNFSFIPSYLANSLARINYSSSHVSPDCSCSSGFPKCSLGAGGDIEYRKVSTLITKDILYDLTERNISDWLVKTEFDEKYHRKRFGGFEFIDSKLNSNQVENVFKKILDFFSKKYPFKSNGLISKNQVKVWYNNKGYFAHVGYLNVINNAILRSMLNANENLADHGIVSINHPMNFTSADYAQQLFIQVFIDLFVAICILFALSFIPASFLVFILEERENDTKQLQFVSGVRPFIYWISNFIWDLVNYFFSSFLCLLIFIYFNVQTYVSKENFPCLVVLMLLYGWACIPLMYPLNYLFKTPSTAFVISSSLNVFIGVITTMTTTILEQFSENEPDLLKINQILQPIFIVLFPHYCLGKGFLDMAIMFNFAQAQRLLGFDATFNPFAFDKIGRNLLALFLQGIFYFLLNLLIEYRYLVKIKLSEKHESSIESSEDYDVLQESKRIETSDDFFKLKQVRKTYRKLNGCNHMRSYEAVKGISLGLKRGDCFGLIGYNGAGKTTTFKMITGEISLTSGSIQIDNENISERKRSSIGYCPQKDAIFDLLTCREHVEYYLRIRGITRVNKRLVELILHKINLNEYSSKISKYLSGGNKRKLSTAISSLCGQTSIICLDEPTSGMDAKAKRYLWNDIKALAKSDRLIILTSHSMDECEQLCNKICIMKNGLFKCLGSPSYIKSKYGNGYKLTIQLNTIEVDTTKNEHDVHNSNHKQLIYTILNLFKESKLNDMHKKSLYEFTIKFNSIKLSQIFDLIELNRHKLNIKDYSVNETTLDQIFVDLAKDSDCNNDIVTHALNNRKDTNAYICEEEINSLFYNV